SCAASSACAGPPRRRSSSPASRDARASSSSTPCEGHRGKDRARDLPARHYGRMRIPFAASERSTVGIEWELALVDADSGDLRQVAETVLEAVRPAGAETHPNVHAELLLNTIEVVSGVCRTVGDAGRDLERTIAELRTVVEPLR